ncbi:RelA/SpoT family protein [bacterium]
MSKNIILELAKEIFTSDQMNKLNEAIAFVEKAHKGQKRSSGQPYVDHCFAVAEILVYFQMDYATILAGLLHDTLEDTQVKAKEIEKAFGKEVLSLILGVTKLRDVPNVSHDETQIEYSRRLILAIAQDIRILILKLADRLHNMRTLDYLSEEKRIRIATETLELYAPLAHRLGIAKIKWELEDLCFKYLYPKEYKEFSQKITGSVIEREKKLIRVRNQLLKLIVPYKIPIRILFRSKNFYSIHKKMMRQNLQFEQIQDKEAVRIITDNTKNCYLILGVIHEKLKPINDTFTDYINVPKANLYQSLHTTVVAKGGLMVEVQIRTENMHRIADYGIAAHWLYKEGAKFDSIKKYGEKIVNDLVQSHEKLTGQEFYKHLREALLYDEIYAVTPKGEIKHLPKGASCIDFAFAVHSDVGIHCYICKVNEKVVSLSHELKNGDHVEVIVSKNAHPSEEWLKITKTSNAKNKIRHYLKHGS